MNKNNCLRLFAHMALALAGATLTVCSAYAQTYPTRTVRVIVGLSPGGSMDVTARLVSDKLKDALGQQIIVENRPGANSVIASELVAKAPPDGYTLMVAGAGTLAIRQKLDLKLPFNAERDFAPIVQVVNLPLLLLTPTALPVRSVRELFTLARARPGDLNYSSSGVGSTTHLSVELLATQAGVKFTHVPYKGSSQMIPDLIAGQISLAFDQITTAKPHVLAGKLRALGVSTLKPTPLMPGLASIAESGVPKYESISWNGFVAPSATPRAVIERLQQVINRLIKTPEVIERFAAMGGLLINWGSSRSNARGRFVGCSKRSALHLLHVLKNMRRNALRLLAPYDRRITHVAGRG